MTVCKLIAQGSMQGNGITEAKSGGMQPKVFWALDHCLLIL